MAVKKKDAAHQPGLNDPISKQRVVLHSQTQTQIIVTDMELPIDGTSLIVGANPTGDNGENQWETAPAGAQGAPEKRVTVWPINGQSDVRLRVSAFLDSSNILNWAVEVLTATAFATDTLGMGKESVTWDKGKVAVLSTDIFCVDHDSTGLFAVRTSNVGLSKDDSELEWVYFKLTSSSLFTYYKP